jgi:hypothetical protein
MALEYKIVEASVESLDPGESAAKIVEASVESLDPGESAAKIVTAGIEVLMTVVDYAMGFQRQYPHIRM